MSILDLPLISLLIITLPLGALLIWIIPNAGMARWITLFAALIDLCLSLTILFNFDSSTPGFQFVEQANWIPTLNIHYKVGIDGISVLFLPVTILIFLGVIMSSWNSIRSMPRLYFSLLLMLESVTLGIFCALDTMLFFLFWELTLIPLYFLISLWGIGPNRRYAAVKYTLFMMAGGVPLLFGFILLGFNHAEVSNLAIPAGLSFDYLKLLKTEVPLNLQITIFFLLLIGFAVKTPIFPFHTWLPTVAMEGPASITAFLTGLKLGAFGILRFVVPLTPAASQQFHWLLAGLGVIGILYGAIAALNQTNLRRMLAFSSFSHVGLVLLGIASFNLQGIQGAVYQLLNFTVIAGGLFLLTGILHHRIGSTDLINLGGVAKTMPILTGFYFLFGLASMGIPGTNGFIAEFLILFSALQTHTGAGLAALAGVVIGSAYFLGSYRRAFLGPVNSQVVADVIDLRKRELLLFLLIAVIIISTGIYPQYVLETTRLASENWIGFLK
ncbi:MAG: NADH-quinone oxidoreductase subunit M [Gammaproteobacteria bacterium]|nr:NADH-quinone oxidoreductase subunit M [Gammaproteobacteria bacterium]